MNPSPTLTHLLSLCASVPGALDALLPATKVPRRYQDNTHCARCEKAIPPGRPGRRCPECRKENP